MFCTKTGGKFLAINSNPSPLKVSAVKSTSSDSLVVPNAVKPQLLYTIIRMSIVNLAMELSANLF